MGRIEDWRGFQAVLRLLLVAIFSIAANARCTCAKALKRHQKQLSRSFGASSYAIPADACPWLKRAHLQFTGRQQAFVDFVLVQYVEQGVEELDTDKLRYRNAMDDVLSDLGSAAQIRQVFIGFQRYLYQD